MLFDTDLTKLNIYNGTVWKNVGNPEIGGDVTGGTSGSVLYVDSSGFLAQDNANFFWDASLHNLGIGTSTPDQKLTVWGNGMFYGTLSASSTAYLPTLVTTTGTITNASTTYGTVSTLWSGLATIPEFNFTNATGTRLFATNGTITNASTTYLTVSNNLWSNHGMFSGGLGVGVATTTNGVIQTSGDVSVGGNLYVSGNSTVASNLTVIGASSANTLTINSSINSNLIPDQNAARDLGSTSYYWKNAYISTLTVNSISAAFTTIGGTQSSSFTINSDNVTTDSEDATLIFFRGTVVPNAIIAWNSATSSKRFEFNQAMYINNGSASTTNPTLTLQTVANQTANALQIIDNNSSAYFTVNPVNNNTTMINASTTNGTITNLWATNGTVANLTFTSASSTYSTVSDTAWINNLVATNASSTYLSIDTNGWLNHNPIVSNVTGSQTQLAAFSGTNTITPTSTIGLSFISGLGTMAVQNSNAVSISGGTITGITDLTVADGGTGASTLTDHGVLVGSGTDVITALTVGTNGQLLVGSTGADPVFATLNCDSNLTCTTGAGTLEIDVDDSFILNTGDTGTGTYTFPELNFTNATGTRLFATNGTITNASTTYATLPTFWSSNANITGGTITGITDLTVADGGTGASTLTGFVYGNGASAMTATTTPYFATGFYSNMASSTYLTVSDTAWINNLVATNATTTTFRSSGLATFGGNVGVGTTSPWAKLSVLATDNSSDNQFLVASSTATSLIVNKYGKVGIGTAVPGTQLHVLAPGQVNTGVPIDVITVEIGAPPEGARRLGYGPSIIFKDGEANVNNMARIAAVYEESDEYLLNGGALLFYTNPFTPDALSERMRITNQGPVGIGTTTPNALLDVWGNVHAYGTLSASSTAYLPTLVTTTGTITNASSTYLSIDTNGWLNHNPIVSNVTGSQTQLAAFSGTNTITPTSTIGLSFISGLGTMATQNANAVSISGGTITGITDLTVADGGTGASTLTGFVYGNGASAMTATTTPFFNLGFYANGNSTITNASTTYATLPTFWSTTGTIGTLTLTNDLTVANGGTGASTLTGILIGNGASAFTASTTLSVTSGGTGVGTLTGFAIGNGTGIFTATTTLGIDKLGVGTIASQNSNAVSISGGTITGITDLTVADGGTGASTLTGFVYGNGASAMTATTTPYFVNGVYMAATSTMNGYSLCTSGNGACGAGGGGSGTVGTGAIGQIPYYAAAGTTLTATSTLTIGTNGYVGIASTSPSALLALTASNSTGLGEVLKINTATSSLFYIRSDGFVGIGTTTTSLFTTSYATTTPLFSVNGNVLISNGSLNLPSVTSTTTIAGGLDVSSSMFVVEPSSGLTSIASAQLGNTNFESDAGVVGWVDMPITSASANNTVLSYSATFNSLATSSLTLYALSAGGGSIKNFGVGIGTTTPTQMLTVSTAGATSSVAITNGWLCVDKDGGCVGAASGNIYYVAAVTGQSDIAENYASETSLENGDIVAAISGTNVERATTTSKTIIGIVSSAPGMILGNDENATSSYPVALSGRVPVKVSLENGPIAIGDRISASSVPGVGMRAATSTDSTGSPQVTVGMALEAYSGAAENRILVFVNLGQPQLAAKGGTGDLASMVTVNSDINMNGFALVNVKSITGLNGLWRIDENGNITAQSVETQKLTVGGGTASGVTVYDRVSGSPTCIYIEGGVIKTSDGACGTTQNAGAPAVIIPASDSVPPVATSTPPVTSTTTPDIIPVATTTPEILPPAVDSTSSPQATTTPEIIVPPAETATTTP